MPQGIKVPQEIKGFKGLLDFKDPPVNKGQRANKVQPGIKVHRESQAFKVPPGIKGLKA